MPWQGWVLTTEILHPFCTHLCSPGGDSWHRAVWRLHFPEWDCPIAEPFFTYDYLNVLKLRAIQSKALSSSVATHMPWATVFDNVLPTSADSTLDSVIESCLRMVHCLYTWFPWDLQNYLVTSRVSVSAHQVPGLASPVFSAADSWRLLLKDFVSHPPCISRFSVPEF